MELNINGKIQAIDVKDKLLVINSDEDYTRETIELVGKLVENNGGLGAFLLPSTSSVESLNVEALQNILKKKESK